MRGHRNLPRRSPRSARPLSVLMLLCVALAACGGKPQQAAPPPPEVLVTDVVQKDVPVHSEWIGTMHRLHQRQDPSAGEGLPADQELQGGRRRARRRPALPDRPARVPGGSSTRRRASWPSAQASLGQDPARRRRATRRSPRKARSASRSSTTPSRRTTPPRRRSTAARAAVEQAKLNLELDQGDLADRRRRRHRHRADRQPGRARPRS